MSITISNQPLRYPMASLYVAPNAWALEEWDDYLQAHSFTAICRSFNEAIGLATSPTACIVLV